VEDVVNMCQFGHILLARSRVYYESLKKSVKLKFVKPK
jgi:hypothetical protein